MSTHLEESLHRDIDRIRARVEEMAGLAERALRRSLRALEQRNRTLAYGVILRDQEIDGREKELDQLCLEFLVRQQPVARWLRLVYATLRVNLELERVGDYAEAIGRQTLKLASMKVEIPFERFREIAELSIPMLHDSVQAFLKEDAALARRTIETERTVDQLKSQLNADLMNLGRENRIAMEALNALMMIARHWERVSDQARNICTETLYLCTGEDVRHQAPAATRVLFLDVRNACRSQMAEAISTALRLPRFEFASAGTDPHPIDPATLAFLREKGLDTSGLASKGLTQIPDWERCQILVTLSKEVEQALPPAPSGVIYLDWNVPDPSLIQGTAAETRAACEATYQFLTDHINELIHAVAYDNGE